MFKRFEISLTLFVFNASTNRVIYSYQFMPHCSWLIFTLNYTLCLRTSLGQLLKITAIGRGFSRYLRSIKGGRQNAGSPHFMDRGRMEGRFNLFPLEEACVVDEDKTITLQTNYSEILKISLKFFIGDELEFPLIHHLRELF